MEEKILIKSEADSGISGRYLTLGLLFLITIVLFVVGIYFLVMSVMVKKTNLTVTDKKVYGRCPNSPQVNIPIKNISAVATFDRNKTVSVTAANGVLSFPGIKNYKEMKDVILKLIDEKEAQANSVQSTPSSMDELQKLKGLLDAGVITQEEFEAKKKQLLNI